MIELDVHAHLAPVHANRLRSFEGVAWDEATKRLTVDGHVVGAKDLFHPERLLARMDKDGVRRALVSIPPPLYRQHLESDDALDWVRYLNAALREIAAASEGRLGALFYIPLEHPPLFPELQRDFAQGGFEGVALAAGGHPGIVYSIEELESLWAWLDSVSAFVFVHPGTCADGRLAKFYLENLVGNPVETGVAAAHLVMRGVPSRYPRIRFCLAHGGGIFSSLLGRLERGFQTERPGVDLSVERPLQAARRFYVDDIAHHPGTLALARELFGEDHVLHGSDWPFPMGWSGEAA